MIRFAIGAAVLAALAGCASTATWQHPSRAGEGQDGATMALAECQSYAAGRTPMPRLQAYMPTPAPTSYRTTGSYTNYGTFQGTTTASGGFASGFASGANMGANIANAYAVSAARVQEEKLTAACMRTLGWIDTSAPEGQEQFKQVSASKLAEITTPKLSAADKVEQGKWIATINTFVETEAARPGGVDYRKDKRMQAQLDKRVKQLANDPKNDQQSSAWYLIEAHKKVLAWDASSKRWADAYLTLFDIEASRPEGIAYRVDEQKAAALEKYIDKLTADPAYDDWKEINLLILANKSVRKDHGLPP